MFTCVLSLHTICIVDCVQDDGVNRKVQPAEGQDMAKKLNAIGYFETSSKTGENVKEAFQSIIDKYGTIHSSKVGGNSASGSGNSSTVDVSAAPAQHHDKKGCC